MTQDSQPTCEELAAEVVRFRAEKLNTSACNNSQAEELDQLSSTPPNDLTILKDGSRSLVGKHTLADGTECVLKYYYPKNLAKKINYRFRGSRAMRSWIAGRTFQLLGIPTPTTMMIQEQHGVAGLTLKQSMLACHLAPGVPLSNITDTSALRDIATQLNTAFETMAAFRISHGDLKANNIIVDTENKIRFIDLDGTTILAPDNKWPALWERDRTRFLRNWTDQHTAQQILSGTIKSADC